MGKKFGRTLYLLTSQAGTLVLKPHPITYAQKEVKFTNNALTQRMKNRK